jgi:hypothetical protein
MLLTVLAACDPAPEGPPPATPAAEPASASTTSAAADVPVEATPMVAGAISPPFVPASLPVASRPACPTRVPKRQPVDSAPPPPGWIVLPGAPSEQLLHCGNLSRREWVVHRAAQGADISLAQKRPPDDPLPFSLSGSAREGLGGTRKVKAVDGGFLVGFDGGEHGGALWWFAQGGERRLRLSDENVIGFAELGGVPVAVTGLSHLGISRGRVMRMSREADAWRVGAWVDLGGASQTYAVESPDSMLVLATSGLLRVTACGDVSVVVPAHYDVLYPTSMVVDDAGIISIGMRHFTTRWIPSASGYREEWLVRIDCAHPQVKKFECVCGG